MASKSGTLYIGVTNDIDVRIAQHKSGEFEGFASKYGCNRLVYYEKNQDVRRAIRRSSRVGGARRRLG